MRIIKRLFSFGARALIGSITHVATEHPVVALTFDDGPDSHYTPRLLDILEKHQARATFFMIGEVAQKHPELLERIAQAGHAIGNHSWDHPSFPLISGRERRSQIRACATAVAPYGERLFRPPYCHQGLMSRLDPLLLGYRVIMFSVATDDWCGEGAASIAHHLERRIRPGSVIVLHDRLSHALEEAHFNREPVLEAVEILLQRLDKQFRFVTIPELLRYGKAQKEIWYQEPALELLNNFRGPTGPARKYAQNGRSKWVAHLLSLLVEIPSR
jgi:peptidoglycan/xylan/chitin deacetylase (PgdA/CDA1 family)